jgi:hypothetical protein
MIHYKKRKHVVFIITNIFGTITDFLEIEPLKDDTKELNNEHLYNETHHYTVVRTIMEPKSILIPNSYGIMEKKSFKFRKL